jgi:hypothetical protein
MYKVISKKHLFLGKKGATLRNYFLHVLVTKFLAGEREDIGDFVSEYLVIFQFQLCMTSESKQK